MKISAFEAVFSHRKPDIQGACGHYAVLVPLVEKNGQTYILYELRAATIETQPLEVCFPGGKIEAGETPMEASLRETFEEIGIPPMSVRMIAELDTYHPASEIVLYPFLAEISQESVSKAVISCAEVEEIFLVPVSFLLSTPPYRYTCNLRMDLTNDFDYSRIGVKDSSYHWRPMKKEITSWKYEDKYIWGMTAQITDHLLQIFKESNT